MIQWGDIVSAVATPIARAAGLPCVDPATNELRPDSPCAKRKQMLNEHRYADVFASFFTNPEEVNMPDTPNTTTTESQDAKKKQFILTKLTLIEAQDAEEALANIKSGVVVSINVAPKVDVQQRMIMSGAPTQTTTTREGVPSLRQGGPLPPRAKRPQPAAPAAPDQPAA